jgi:hypothetical protein
MEPADQIVAADAGIQQENATPSKSVRFSLLIAVLPAVSDYFRTIVETF